MGFPVLIRHKHNILCKINNLQELKLKFRYIMYYISNKYNAKEMHLYKIKDKFIIIRVYFQNNEPVILKLIYTSIDKYILFYDIEFANFFFKTIKKKYKYYNCKYINLIYQNNEFYFLDLVDDLTNDLTDGFVNRLIFDKKYVLICNNKIIKFTYKNELYYELDKNYDIKKINCEKTYICDKFVKNNICRIIDGNYKLKYPKQCIDNNNTLLLNKFINNNINEKVIECYENIDISFYGNTYIKIYGISCEMYINGIKCNNVLYKIIKIKNGDNVNITCDKYFYITFSNGVSINRFNDIVMNKYKINFNKIDEKYEKLSDNIEIKYIKNYIYDNYKKKYCLNNYELESYKEKIIILSKKNDKKKLFELPDINNYLTKAYKYPFGSIIMRKNNIFIINNTDFKYINGNYIGFILTCDLWKLNYIENYSKNKSLIFKEIIRKNKNNNEEFQLINDKYIISIFNKKNKKNILDFFINAYEIKDKIIFGNDFYIFDYKYIKNIYKQDLKNIEINIVKIPIMILNKKYNEIKYSIILEKNNDKKKSKYYIYSCDNNKYMICENILYFNKKKIADIIFDDFDLFTILIFININNNNKYLHIQHNYVNGNYFFDSCKKKMKISKLIKTFNYS